MASNPAPYLMCKVNQLKASRLEYFWREVEVWCKKKKRPKNRCRSRTIMLPFQNGTKFCKADEEMSKKAFYISEIFVFTTRRGRTKTAYIP